MGCSNNKPESSNEIDVIKKGFDDLIKSVKEEMDEYENQIKKYDIKQVDNINYEYDQIILKIFHDKNSYIYDYLRDNYLKCNYLNSVQSCLNNLLVKSNLKPGIIIKLNEIQKKRNDEIQKLLNGENKKMYNELKQKIAKCQNQIKEYEKDKQNTIIAKREELRNKLMHKNIDNGVLSQYGERRGYNNQVKEDILDKINKDYS